MLALLLVAGCASKHAQVGINSPTAPSTGGGTIGVATSHRTLVGELIAIGALIGLYAASEREADEYGQRTRVIPGEFYGSGAAPMPDPARRVAEQDCTRPVVDRLANLRCR